MEFSQARLKLGDEASKTQTTQDDCQHKVAEVAAFGEKGFYFFTLQILLLAKKLLRSVNKSVIDDAFIMLSTTSRLLSPTHFDYQQKLSKTLRCGLETAGSQEDWI